ncbi:unnamed protein product, partial [Rotaria sp. Silwood1]
STELHEWTKKANLNVFNMLGNIKRIHDDLNLAQNQMKNFPSDSSCNLLPVDIRPEDLLCLLAPEHTSIIQMICSKFNDIELFLSCRTDKVEPMHLSATLSSLTATHGLSSYIYRHQTSMISLFDRQKHIHYIVNATVNIIQQLIDLCIDPQIQESLLMKICTSVKELYPIQMALALILMILIDWAATSLADFKENQHLLKLTTLKNDEIELLNIKTNLHQLEQEANKLEQDLNKRRREREDAELERNIATIEDHFLVENLDKKVNEFKQNLEQLTNSYNHQLEQKQQQWMINLLNYFEKISQIIKTYIISLGKRSESNISITTDLNTLLKIPVSIAYRSLLEITITFIDDSQIDSLQIFISEILNDVRSHSMSLAETDPMHLFISFYCDVINISLSSLKNSSKSWKYYSKILETSQMKFYSENKKKQNLCQLNLSIREQCSLFLNQIRTGYEQNDIIKNAQIISKYVRSEVIKFDTLMANEQNKQVQHLIREFERFVIYLLIAGCHYLQLQRGIRESLDDILIGITTETIDLSQFPRTEIDLLNLLDRYEIQLKSHSDTLLFLPLHLCFAFNSNPFNLFDQIERSLQILIQFILPSVFLIERTWSTIDKLLEKISQNLTDNEYLILNDLCNKFLYLTNESCIINDQGDFVSKQLQTNLFECLSKLINNLCDEVLKNRLNMKLFCDDLNQRWHLTMKEMFRGFIKTQKFHIHRQLTWNQRKVKQINSSLFSSEINDTLRLADIEKILQRKNTILQSINLNQRSKYLMNLYYLQTIYQLTIGGIDNLELIIMNMPMENMDYDLYFKLLYSTRDIYNLSEKLLLEQPLMNFIHHNQQIELAFKLLENIYRQEYRIFQDFYIVSKEQVENSSNDLWSSIDFHSLVKQVTEANEQWINAGKDFIQLRRKVRTNDEALIKKVKRKLMNFGRSLISIFSSNTYNDFDECFAVLLQDILLYMQSQQHGIHGIFTMADQGELNKIIDLHKRYQSSHNLALLNKELFPTSENIFLLQIERLNKYLKEIYISFWNSNKEKSPCLTLTISLNNALTKICIVLRTQITHLAIHNFDISGMKMRWSTLVDNQIPYHIINNLKLTCQPIYQKYCFTVNGVASDLNISTIPSIGDLQNSLRELEEQLIVQNQQHKEEEEFQSSPITRAIQTLTNHMKEILPMINCPKLSPNDLSTPSNIYHLFMQLPQVDVLKKIFDLLDIKEFASISPLIQFVHDDDPAIRLYFQSVQTYSMEAAFSSSRQCLLDAKAQLQHFINNLHLNRVHLVLIYAWTNALSIHGSLDTQQEFSTMLNECTQLSQIPMENNQENVQHLNECRRVLKDAQRIFRTIKRTSNNWIEIKRLISLSSLTIEDNFTMAFIHSEMSRDAHLWLIETMYNDDISTSLTCHPKKAILDFGSTLSGIHQRLTQRIFIHNHTDRDLNLRVDRTITDDTAFDVTNENVQVNAGHMCEFEIFLRPPATIGSFNENWNLLIDNTITLSNVIQTQIQIVEIDVEKSADTIDFGFVACSNNRIEKTIDLKNVLTCPVRIKSQLQATEINQRQSHLLILNNEFDLPANSILPFGIALEPTDNIEEDIDADVCLAINSAKNLKWIKVLAHVRRLHLAVVYQGRTYIEKNSLDRVLIDDFYKGEKRIISTEFRNDGPIEYTLRLSSTKLILTMPEVNLPVNTMKTVPIEIQMSTNPHQEFVLFIDFVNNKRQCQLTFDCQTAEAKLTYSTRTTDIKKIITIAQSVQMQQIWNADRHQLLPIEHEITFMNASKAAATLSYRRIVSAQDPRTPLGSQFHIEPDNLIIPPQSKVPVRFLYHPVDLGKFDVQVEVQTNTSIDSISIPYYVEFQTPILQTIPRTVIDIGLIQTGKIFKENMLIIKNIGQRELRFVISDPIRPKPFVKVVALQESSTILTPSSINQTLRVNPNQQRIFSIMIECDVIDNRSISEIIGLVEFELISICDPVIDINGTLVNRTVTIVVVGHTLPLRDFALPKDLNPNLWCKLQLLPSSWLYQLCREYTVHSSYTSLVALTAIAHVCGSQNTKDSLPKTKDEWSMFCMHLPRDRQRTNKDLLTLDLFSDETTVNTAIDTLVSLLRSSFTNYRSFFYHSSLFHRSFSNNESIRLQLFAVINSAANIDEAYAMQSYSAKLWNIYEKCSSDDAFRQAIEFVHQCISNDCAIPESIRIFTKFIHQIVQPSTTVDVAQHLLTVIPSKSSFGELMMISTNPSDLKLALLLAHFNDHVKEIMIKLIKNDWQALLDLHLMLIEQQNPISVQRSLLEAVKSMHTLWNSLNINIKSDLLESLFTDYTQFIPILKQASNKQRVQLNDLLTITEIIFKRFEPSQTFYLIRNVFKEIYYYEISQALNSFSYLPHPPPNHLVSQILEFRRTLIGDMRNPMIHTGNNETFCDILRQLVLVTASQWIFIKKSINVAYHLLCDIGDKHITLVSVIAQVLSLLDTLNPDKNWYSIRQSYMHLCSTPTWETILKFIDILHCHQEAVHLTQALTDATTEETMAETILKLCRLVSTNDELKSLNAHEPSIRQLSSNILPSSSTDFFERIQSLTPPVMQQKMHAYLTLLRLSSHSILDEESQHLLFDNIIASWLTLFDINCAKSLRFFSVISSILTSFLGLVSTRDIAFSQQLYTTSLASALCILANCRQNTREIFTTNSSIGSTINFSSIITAIRESLTKRIYVHRIPSSNTDQTISASSSVPQTVLTRMTSIECPYSDETLTKMEISVLNYSKNLSQSSIVFVESDTVRDIVDAALVTRTQVTQWYANFITFNVLVHYRSNSNDLNQIKVGHDIIQYGLQLLRHLFIARKILEPTFAHVGVRFLMKELIQIEKCLLSLALEKYPMMLKALRQLNVDVSRIKVDFKPPSNSIAPKGRSSNQSKFDILPQINTAPQSIGPTSGSVPVINNNDDAPITFDDWESAIRTSNNEQLQDTLKLAKKKQEKKLKTKKKQLVNSNFQTNVQNLATGMLDQNTNKTEVTSISSGTTQSDISPVDMSLNQEISIDLQMKAMHEHLQKQPNLIEMYEKADSKVASTVPDGKLDNRSVLKPSEQHQQWTYQLLVEVPAISRMIDLIVQEFRSHWEKLDLLDEHEIRWCIMIDNSGSMSIHRNAIYEALVIIMELLRKLERKFAVARFGTRTNQKILKNLNDLFTNQDGQYVLEALTFDEGTYPATGLARIADRVFPVVESEQSSTTIVHRLVLMITDGLTQERDDASYSRTITKHKINLGFMFIETVDQNSSQVLLKGLTQAQSCILKANNITELPLKVPQLMHEMIKACLTKTSSSSLLEQTMKELPTINIRVPTINDVTFVQDVANEKQSYIAANPTSYTISSPTANIPKLAQIRSQLTSYLSRSSEYTDYASHAVDLLRQYYHTLKVTSTMQDIEKKWIGDEYHFSGLIDDLSTVLGDLVFPLNKFTRRRAALRGSSLYLPGLIKAMTTEWNYKKIFSAKLAGGKRDHAMCLVIDVSTSMFGTLSIGTIDTIVILIAALRKLSLENFGIIVFGENVRLIKTSEQAWDTTCIYTLIQQLRFDRDDDTKDADAIEAAIDLLDHCSVRGEKRIFILTDGYSNCGSRLSIVQQRAEDHGIDLLAMAIGIDQTNLKSVYKRYLQCATPYGLPKALRALFENETQLFSLEWPPNINTDSNKTDDSIITIDNLFDDIKSKKIFRELIEDLVGQRDLMLINSGQPPSNMTVDICFCLDCTGSMSRWISAAKDQMKSIIEGITKLIEKEYPSLKLQLRFAIVGYRDIGDQPQFFTQDFTDDTNQVINFLNTLIANGGGDIPEDVLSALDRCLTLTNWSNTNARFIVLITDAPGHGPELNDNLNIDRHPQGTGIHTVKSICDRLLKKDAEIDLMFCQIKPKATAKMEKAFQTHYDAQKDETGKVFTTIQLFDDKQQETQSFHFVFVLDESGSMAGEWNSLQSAYGAFLTRRNDDQGGDDHFSVIQFESNARIICQQQSLSNTPRFLSMNGGGTDYCQGLNKANQAIAADHTASSVVMIFMSDGADGSRGDPVALIRQFKQNYGTNHKFVCHTVGFGSGIARGSKEAQLLQNMASDGGGRAYSALTGAELQTVFNHIAANSTTSDALVERFSAILAQNISIKIMVDYL